MRIGEIVRIAVIAVPVAALIGGAAAVVGVDGAHAVAIGAVALAASCILFAQRTAPPQAERERVAIEPPMAGRRDLDQLAWSMVEHRTRIRGPVVDRVRRIAEHRLAARGVDLHRGADAPRAEALLGPTAWAVLRPDGADQVTPRAFDATLRALEQLPPPVPEIPRDRTTRAR